MSAVEHQVIPASEVRAAESERVSLLTTFAQRYGMEANNMMRTLRSTVLRPNKEGREPTNEQVAAFLIVAHNHNLNPFTKEIHGFLDKWGGIVSVVGLDGWAKKINEHPQFDGMTFEQDDEKCTCTMYRKDRKHPTVHTEYLIECKRPTDPWSTHPKRMLSWKALIQTARIAFGFAGIYEPDEAEAVVAAIDKEVNVTPVTPTDEVEHDTNFGKVKISPVRKRKIIEDALAAVKANEGKGDAAALWAVWGELSNGEIDLLWRELRSYERSALKKLMATDEYKAVGISPWAVTLIVAVKDLDALEKGWTAVQDAFAASDAQVPADIETLYHDRKAELGGA